MVLEFASHILRSHLRVGEKQLIAPSVRPSDLRMNQLYPLAAACVNLAEIKTRSARAKKRRLRR